MSGSTKSDEEPVPYGRVLPESCRAPYSPAPRARLPHQRELKGALHGAWESLSADLSPHGTHGTCARTGPLTVTLLQYCGSGLAHAACDRLQRTQPPTSHTQAGTADTRAWMQSTLSGCTETCALVLNSHPMLNPVARMLTRQQAGVWQVLQGLLGCTWDWV